LGTVIELCRRCGFDIPVGADGCPGCGAERVEAERLAARQLAGLALPTRSVRSLPNTPPQHVAEPPPVTPAVGARTVFAYTWLLTVVAVLGGLLAWVANLDRYVSALPQGTAAWFEEIAVMATVGSIIGLVLGFVAMGWWCVRRVSIAILRHRRTRLSA